MPSLYSTLNKPPHQTNQIKPTASQALYCSCSIRYYLNTLLLFCTGSFSPLSVCFSFRFIGIGRHLSLFHSTLLSSQAPFHLSSNSTNQRTHQFLFRNPTHCTAIIAQLQQSLCEALSYFFWGFHPYLLYVSPSITSITKT